VTRGTWFSQYLEGFLKIRHTKLFAACAGVVVALTIACSESSTPVSPSSSPTGENGAGPDGQTLKIAPPPLMSPANGSTITSTSSVTFTVGRVTGTHASFPVTIEFDIARQGGAQLDNTKLAQGSSNSSSYTMNRQLEINTVYTYRARATYNNAFGPWSPTFTFRTPDIPPAYVRVSGGGGEIFDPLTNGITAGNRIGPTQFIPGVGLKMLTQASHVTYTLPENLQQGEFSLMITGVDEGSPGDKSKIMSMQEGPDENDITDDDYRMTAELRGRSYNPAGAVTFRIITGGGHDTIFDGVRTPVEFTDTRWYFWKFTWGGGRAQLEVRNDGPNGGIIYSSSVGTGPRPYRPTPHLVHIGAPVGRAGDIDATIGGLIAKDVWLGAGPRPNFPPSAVQALTDLLSIRRR
jgi:hypothetical protein